MMDSGHGGQEELAAAAGLRDALNQPGTAVTKRVSGGRESYPQISAQRRIALIRW